MSSDYMMDRLLKRRSEAGQAPCRPTYYRSGANDGYWNASCDCGWQSKAWTHRKSDVVREYHGHERRGA